MRMENPDKTKPKSSTSINSLPLDVLKDIFLRLPMETLFSCSCVSKLFRSIFFDPFFTQLCFATSLLVIPFQHKKNEILHLLDLREVGLHLDLPIETRINLPIKSHFPGPADLEVVNSCHGLICLRKPEKKNPIIYVCNPILGEFITLPNYPNPKQDTFLVDTVAIGFSSNTTKEYKVLRILYNNLVLEAEVYVIGDGTGSWRSIGQLPPCRFYNSLNFDVFLYGAVHWVAPRDQPLTIWAFDFDREVFREVPKPRGLKEGGDFIPDGVLETRVGVLNGRHLSIHNFRWEVWFSYCFDIWVMMEYGLEDSWTRLYCFSSSITDAPQDHSYTPLKILSSGTILMLDRWMSLKSYNPKTKVFGSCDIGVIRKYSCGIALFPSFVSMRNIANREEVKICSL